MKKKINVILIKDYKQVGQKGAIKNVSLGYARNYLIPNCIAEVATKNTIKHLNMFKEIKNKKIEKNQILIKKIKEKLDYIQKISIYRKKGDNYFIFGNIVEKDIVNHINKYINIIINKKQIEINEIKELGSHNINIKISDNLFSKIKLINLPINI
uniref:Large ribosomal subunit protein bL9c n=1 Tax=Cliftonaea pectinata TaxID=2007206 RepID=A0A1Z1MQP3_9FLOR|nr:ribosomal protein L9 [Cliftonaea pectinata]ARW68095.1 ribosomal protein L9 [Cliftonaea pectinata]